ncbi:hypothetical protein Tco_0095838, partial [Tanacetum coccineum]
LRMAQKTIKPQPPITASIEALIAEYASTPTTPSPPPSPLAPLLFPLTHIPSPPLTVPSPPLLLSSTNHRSNIPQANMSPWKRLCLIALIPMFEVGESSAAAATR